MKYNLISLSNMLKSCRLWLFGSILIKQFKALIETIDKNPAEFNVG